MVTAALPGRIGSAIPQAGLPSIQNVLLVYFDKTETDRFSRYLGDAYHLFPVRTERQLLTMPEVQAIQVVIINTEAGYPFDGIQLCSRLKSMPRFAHLVVILVIPTDNQAVRIGCLESGADAWMERPLSRDYVRAQLRNLLANRRRLKSYFGQASLFAVDSMACTGENKSFLSRLTRIIVDHLADTDLNVDVLAQLMNISRPTLYRKIKCISDRTPNELVTIIRLNKAAELLSAGDNKVLEIARSVGFHSRSNFGKAFVKHFKVTPLEYRGRAKRQ